MERELARVKVSASRIASVAANGWKDENDKVMPVKQWLEDRKVLQVYFSYRPLLSSPKMLYLLIVLDFDADNLY